MRATPIARRALLTSCLPGGALGLRQALSVPYVPVSGVRDGVNVGVRVGVRDGVNVGVRVGVRDGVN
ncbi:MAG: hypothetical protein ACUVWS_00410, partial [Roseiflexus sp.]